MKRIFLFILLLLPSITTFGNNKIPENLTVTQKLKSNPTYNYVDYDDYGWYTIKGTSGTNYIADTDGNIVFSAPYESMYYYPEFKLVSYKISYSDKTSGIARIDGTVLIAQGKYNGINPHDGWIEVYINDNSRPHNAAYGAHDMDGKPIIPATHDIINKEYKKDYLKVIDSETTALYNLSGKEIIVGGKYESISIEDRFDEVWFSVDKNKKNGALNAQGLEIIPCQYDFIRDFNLDKDTGYLLLVNSRIVNGRKIKLNGLARRSGEIVIPCEYDEEFLPFRRIETDGQCVVSKEGKKGVISIEGKEILPCMFKDISIIGDMVITVDTNDAKGLFSIDGIQLLNNQYSEINLKAIDQHKAITIKNGGYEIYDTEARRFLTDRAYSRIETISDGLMAAFDGSKWGYIDSLANVVIPFEYDKVTPFQRGVAQVQKEGQSSLLAHPNNVSQVKIASLGASVSVDKDIPQSTQKRENTFVFIIACENYSNLCADYAVNDGRIMKEYCIKTLGIPKNNIHYIENASLGTFLKNLSDAEDIADVYEGDAEFIFYFAGLGTISGATSEPLLLFCDSELATCEVSGYSLHKVAERLGKMPSRYCFVLIDAPVNGTGRDGKPLEKSRGVKIKSKPLGISSESLVMVMPAEGADAQSHSLLNHGIITYCALEHLQQASQGFTLQQFAESIVRNTKKRSLELNGAVQQVKVATSTSSQVSQQKL